MLSPTAFAEGSASDPNTANSCHVGWGTIGSKENPDDIVCAGISNISGTGPFKFASRTTETRGDAEVDIEVIFDGNSDYWGGAPTIQTLKIVRFETSDDVKTALLQGNLDVIWGAGVLSDKDIAEIQDSDEHQGHIKVFHSKDIQNVILLLNSGKSPLNDINIRKTVIHAINKPKIVEKELAGLQKVVDNVFPLDAPSCEVDLTPRWDYDIEKATLLFCKNDESINASSGSTSLALGLGIGLGGLFFIAAGVALYVNKKRMDVQTELNLLRKNEAVSA